MAGAQHVTAAVTDPAGRLLAHATTTCLIFPADGGQPRSGHPTGSAI
ncbi:hypothetical protein [Streptomyces canus]